uniref:CATSPERG beta-propeller domain-containing protein n=1 Tax=Urocitellus parryii TaxID=9999 RepID=A0A8D2HG21_UROPR
VRCQTMSPASPVWLRVRVLRVLWALLAVLLGPWRLWAVIYDFHECTWHVVLNKFQRRYLGFPYYLKINYSCNGQLSIDSCWVGSFYCPQADFSATIYDAISTESTLFIRQNQLIYYYTGTYATLYDSSHSSGKWVRVLASECIKRLCPVYFSSNGSDHVIALTTGKHEGYLHLGTITDGLVSFELLPRNQTTCRRMLGIHLCLRLWERKEGEGGH